MSDLRLVTVVDAENPTAHDLMVVSGQILWAGMDLYAASEQATMIAQRVRCRLLMIRGEWYLDQRLGTPWRDVLTAKGTSVARMERIFREVIAGTPGVAAVTACTVSLDHITRTAEVVFRATADTGQVVGPVTLSVPFIVSEGGHG